MRELLQNGPFARLLFGRLVTNAGDSLYYIAAMWLVYRLTGSTVYTGVAGFLTMAPSLARFLFGPLVDRLPLRRTLVGSQLAQGVLVLVVPLAAALDVLSVWIVLTVMPLVSLLNQPVYPAESAALPRIVEREELVEANSLFAFAYQGVDAGFNAVGGVLVAAVGAVTLFLVDSVTFVAAVALYATVSIPAVGVRDERSPPKTVESSDSHDGGPAGHATDSEPSGTTTNGGNENRRATSPVSSYYADLKAGIVFLRGTVVTKLLVGVVVVNFSTGGVLAVLPAYSDSLGGADAYGLLIGAIGVGQFTGALSGSVVERFPFGRVVSLGMVASAVLWGGAVAADWVPASAFLFGLALVPAGVLNVLISSLVQTLVPDDLLGRVTAVIGSASVAMSPVGALVGGALAGATSTKFVLWAAGVSFAMLGLYVFAVPSLRRMPQVSEVPTLAAE